MKDQNTKDKISLFLDASARIEGLCAELYHFYSDIFHENGEASQLWKKTALEEENHMRQFQLATRLRNVAEFELEADLERAYRIHNKLQRLLDHVRCNPPDIVTALSKAIEMEESLADMHLESSVRFGNESFRQMFKAMRDFDQEHIVSLKRFLAIMMLPKTDMGV